MGPADTTDKKAVSSKASAEVKEEILKFLAENENNRTRTLKHFMADPYNLSALFVKKAMGKKGKAAKKAGDPVQVAEEKKILRKKVQKFIVQRLPVSMQSIADCYAHFKQVGQKRKFVRSALFHLSQELAKKDRNAGYELMKLIRKVTDTPESQKKQPAATVSPAKAKQAVSALKKPDPAAVNGRKSVSFSGETVGNKKHVPPQASAGQAPIRKQTPKKAPADAKTSGRLAEQGSPVRKADHSSHKKKPVSPQVAAQTPVKVEKKQTSEVATDRTKWLAAGTDWPLFSVKFVMSQTTQTPEEQISKTPESLAESKKTPVIKTEPLPASQTPVQKQQNKQTPKKVFSTPEISGSAESKKSSAIKVEFKRIDTPRPKGVPKSGITPEFKVPSVKGKGAPMQGLRLLSTTTPDKPVTPIASSAVVKSPVGSPIKRSPSFESGGSEAKKVKTPSPAKGVAASSLVNGDVKTDPKQSQASPAFKKQVSTSPPSKQPFEVEKISTHHPIQPNALDETETGIVANQLEEKEVEITPVASKKQSILKGTRKSLSSASASSSTGSASGSNAGSPEKRVSWGKNDIRTSDLMHFTPLRPKLKKADSVDLMSFTPSAHSSVVPDVDVDTVPTLVPIEAGVLKPSSGKKISKFSPRMTRSARKKQQKQT